MTVFQDLDPETRAFALVGQFLHRWAAMESELNQCIRTSFKLTPTMNHIICGNFTVYDKLTILRTIIFVSALDVDSERIKFNKLLRRIGKYAFHRNMIAHTSFQTNHPKAGVQFAHIKAKGTYETTPIIWTVRRFEQEGIVLDCLEKQLNELNERLRAAPIRDIAYEQLLRASISLPWGSVDWPVPMRHTMTPALLNHLSLPILPLLDSDSAKAETMPQTPETPREDK